MSKYAFAAAAALSALIASSAAMADTISAPAAFTVSVEVLAGCTINSNGGDATFAATAGTATIHARAVLGFADQERLHCSGECGEGLLGHATR